jgi:hypothetical protein
MANTTHTQGNREINSLTEPLIRIFYELTVEK